MPSQTLRISDHLKIFRESELLQRKLKEKGNFEEVKSILFRYEIKINHKGKKHLNINSHQYDRLINLNPDSETIESLNRTHLDYGKSSSV